MGLFDDIGKSVSSSFSDVGSFVSKGVQAIGNFYGFDNNGKWTNQGGEFKWMDEAAGEVTGRNQSRASLNLAKDQFSYAQAQAQQLITQQQWNRQQADVLSSNNAGAATRTAAATSGINMTTATPTALGPGFNMGGSKDFLGL
jgi:hypothetical protein